MTQDIEEFKKAHGQQWGKIVNMSSFNAGMVLLSVKMMTKVRSYTDEQIHQHGSILLAELRGWMTHEAELMGLPALEQPKQTEEVHEQYVNQIDENFEEHMRLSQKP